MAAGSVAQYLRGVMGDGVNDVALRADWRARGGLCAAHWRAWRSLETPALSSAVLLRDLLESAISTEAPRRRRFRPEPTCPACDRAKASERVALDALARDARAAAALAGARGFVCVRHTRALPPGPLRQAADARLQALLADLDAFIRAQDHRFATEPIGEVGDAWLRAIRAVGGDV